MPVVQVIRRGARAPAAPSQDPVTDPLGIVSLEEMRRQLRLGASTGASDPYDAIVTTAIRSGVAFVARNTTVPLLDSAESCQVEAPADAGYVEVPVAYIRSITRVRYWTAVQGYRVDPAGEILPANLGRVVLHKEMSFVYPPTDGWPVRRAGSPLLVDLVRGAAVDEDHVLYQAVVVAARLFFHGYEEIPVRHAVWALMSAAAP